MTSGEALSGLLDSGGKYGQAAKGSNMYKQWRAILGAAEGESLSSILSDTTGIFGGLFSKDESPEDLKKQDIQKKLKNMGFPEFSSMSGWKGDEAKKMQAMKLIYQVVAAGKEQLALDALNGGDVTPETIQELSGAVSKKAITLKGTTGTAAATGTAAQTAGMSTVQIVLLISAVLGAVFLIPKG